jgi:transposase
VEQFERIRRDAREKDMSIRRLAAKHNVHRRTVRAALACAVPPPRKEPARTAPVLGPWLETITGWLKDDLDAPRKQRHTGRRVWQRLVEEHGAVIAESTVTHAVARIRRELSSAVADVAVPQTHAAGSEAEVDFGEFWAVIGGVRTKLYMFVMRLSFSGKAAHVAYANQGQESFLDGHVIAFERFGGVPTRMVRYDNLKPAVIRLLLGRERIENQKFIALRSHYGFDSFFCRPGLEGAHEKGGVEGEVGRYRRRWLTPVPEFVTIADLNAHMADCDARDDGRAIGTKPATVGALFGQEAGLLRPLPADVFDAAETLSFKADGKSRVCVRQSYYSVPARYAGRRVSVRVGARQIEMFADGTRIASHVRAIHKYSYTLELDHYLEVLTRKPGALAGATALTNARASGAFTPLHQKFWDRARRDLGDSAGTRSLIEVLLLSRTLSRESLNHAMERAMAAGDFDPERIAVTARTHHGGTMPATAPAIPLPAAVLERMAAVPKRRTPSLAGYDLLLTGAGDPR